MTNDLEGKIQAPTVVFAEGIVMSGSSFGAVHFARSDGNQLDGFISLGYGAIEAVYDANGEPRWQNRNLQNHRKVEMPEHLKGLQVVFTAVVVYEGADFGALHFSSLKDGRYEGHKDEEGLAMDFAYNLIKAIYDTDGKAVWENWNYKPAQAETTPGK
jgi:hypothetical protein